MNADEKRTLNLFLRQVDEIRDLGMINRRLEPVSVTLSFSAESGVTSQIKGLNKDAFRSLLTGLRQFCSPNEKVNLGRICNILEKSGLDSNLLAWERAARKRWKITLQSCPSHYYLDGKAVTVEDSIKLYFNGVLFHSDPQVAMRWDQLDEYEKNIMVYTIRAALPPLIWTISTIDTIVDTVLHQPNRSLPKFPVKSP